jgi:myo-inositol-1(or 4)-monophosphatase
MMNKELRMNKELTVLLEAVEESGDAILALQHSGFSISKKNNHELLTQADLLANDILKNKLTAIFPESGWLSEESIDDILRLQCDRVWIVDPIDGTKEFATSVPEFAISVALIDKGVPIVSAVFNPAKDELFYAVKGKGAWLNTERIFCEAHKKVDNLLLLASRSENDRGEWERFKMHHRVKAVGSIAYKLALIAGGFADATFSLGPKHEWDIAGGTLLVLEAGGCVSDKEKQTIVFNQSNVKVNGIVATNASCYDQVFALINDND